MKKILALALFGLLLLAPVATLEADAHRGINQRQSNQRHRIHHGFKNGELTRKESRKLALGQRNIQRLEHRFRADGHLNRKERARLHHQQNKQNHKIYRLSHNHRDRH